MYLIGLRNTVFIAIGACLLGLLIGIVVTTVRILPKTNVFVKILDAIARLYVTVIRGTPSVLQLFICYFVLLKFMKSSSLFGIPDTAGIPVAIITFGINSGAYMAEILRGGIQGVDGGQMEAGRSLGLNWFQTFIRIVLPQSLKSAVPTMFNEFITLIKETAVVGYVGAMDITKAFQDQGSNSYEYMIPYLVMALIYIILVAFIAFLVKLMERRLAKSERRN